MLSSALERWRRKIFQPAGFAFLAIAFFAAYVARMHPRDVKELALAEDDCRDIDERLVLRLDRFSVSHYPGGKPKQYASYVKTLDCTTGGITPAKISVNHPFRQNGWWIYQMGCGFDDTVASHPVFCTVLRCVRDPFLPLAAAAGAFALAGALLLCFVPRSGGCRPATRVRRALSTCAAIVAVALPLFIVARAVFAREPPPALQSVLMAPHAAAYAASYAILLFAAFGIGRRAVPTGFLLMTIGLVTGALWGKFVWSDWWQFDPKENWSLATWCAFAIHLALPRGSRWATAFLWVGAVLIGITFAWVNFSGFAESLHAYAGTVF